MTLRRELTASLQLMRPRQWPILSAQLGVGAVLGSTTPGVCVTPDYAVLAAAWAAWVVMLNGGTLAFNSAYDRDDGPVAYLARPPEPPRWLPPAALAVMLAGAATGLAVSLTFASVVLGCVVLSVLYSHPAVRWKAVPGLDLAVNMVGYGAGTTLAGLLAGAAAGTVGGRLPAGAGWVTAGFGLLFGSLYPLTQLYQADEDRRRGDRTLATALGRPRALELALVLGLLAAGALGAGLAAAGHGGRGIWPGAALALWTGHLVWLRTRRAPSARLLERAMYTALGLWAAVDVALVAAWLG
jgi:4-hydroxybenzoate polyprenyltransferase